MLLATQDIQLQVGISRLQTQGRALEMGDIWKAMIPILNPLNDGVLTVSLMILLVLEMFRKRTETSFEKFGNGTTQFTGLHWP